MTWDGRHLDTGWTAPTFVNSWVNFGSPHAVAGYCATGGIVYLKGLIKSGTLPGIAFTLPVGFRPLETHIFAPWSGNGTSSVNGRVDIDSAGAVWIQSGSNLSFSLAGIAFHREQ